MLHVVYLQSPEAISSPSDDDGVHMWVKVCKLRRGVLKLAARILHVPSFEPCSLVSWQLLAGCKTQDISSHRLLNINYKDCVASMQTRTEIKPLLGSTATLLVGSASNQ